MYKSKSILAIITARGSSKGIPRKNIKTLAGKPMIAWSIEAAKKSKYIDRVIVSTDDIEIKDISVSYGAEIPFLRPDELAKDDTSSADVIFYTINRLTSEEKKEYDYIMLLQPTSPLRNETHIDDAIEKLINEHGKYDSLISVTKLEHPVYWNRIINENGTLESFLKYDKNKNYRRQAFQQLYRLNGAIYIIESKVFLEVKSFETVATKAFIMDEGASIDVDILNDFEIAEYYLKRLPNW